MNPTSRDGSPRPDGRLAPDGKDASGDRARGVERRLIVVRVEPKDLAQLGKPGGGLLVDLGPPVDAYGEDWLLVSHTFSIQPTGEGILSVLFERLGGEPG